MQRLIFVRNGGHKDSREDTVVISSEKSPALRYVIGSPKGLGAVGVRKTSSTAAGMDGAHLQGIELEARTVTDTITVLGKTRAEMYENRLHLQRVLNPHFGMGTLYYTNDFGQWKIDALPDGYGVAKERISESKCKVDVSFYCPDPYWTDIAPQKIYLSQQAAGGILLPTALPAAFPKGRVNQYVLNSSGEEAFTKVVITGPAKGVRIVNKTTGEEMAFNMPLEPGDQLVLDSKNQTARLTTNSGTSEIVIPRYGYRFITLKPGVNHIAVEWYRAFPGASATMEWVCRYVGV